MATSAICKTLAEEDAKEWLWALTDQVRSCMGTLQTGWFRENRPLESHESDW